VREREAERERSRERARERARARACVRERERERERESLRICMLPLHSFSVMLGQACKAFSSDLPGFL